MNEHPTPRVYLELARKILEQSRPQTNLLIACITGAEKLLGPVCNETETACAMLREIVKIEGPIKTQSLNTPQFFEMALSGKPELRPGVKEAIDYVKKAFTMLKCGGQGGLS